MKIAEERLAEIYQHALACFPEECCGIVIGPSTDHIGLEDCVKPITNIQNQLHQQDPTEYPRDARTGYYMDPKEMLAVFREAEEKGLAIKAFFHSHPNERAYFSPEDTKRALMEDEPTHPEATYLVISVFPERIADIKGFRWNPQEKQFTEVSVVTKEKINLNTASIEELIKLKGIGPQRAVRIIEYRQKQGPFTRVADLVKVKGIGKKILAQNARELSTGRD